MINTKIKMILFIITLKLNVFGQNFTKSSFNTVIYNVSHKYDTILNSTQKYQMQLIFNDSLSLYSASLNSNKYFRKEGKDNSIINIGIQSSASKDKYYTNIKTSHIYRERSYLYNGFSQTTYLMPDTLEHINWNISNEFKMIDTFKCQKAYCTYRGRDYIAYFCTDIASNYGPWKLYGLPGLILEAFDTKTEISFKFSSLSKSDISIQLPIKHKIINELEFEKMKLNELNTDSFTNSYMSVSVEIKDSKGEIIQKKVLPINNPIDLLTKLPYTF